MINTKKEMGYRDWKTKDISKSFSNPLFFLEALWLLPTFVMKIKNCFLQPESCVEQPLFFTGIKVQKHFCCLTKGLKLY